MGGGKIVSRVWLLAVLVVGALAGAESDAVALAANVRARHMPFGTVLDPIFASAASDQIVGYTRCGDSALWTGTYLAGEAFRYQVTGAAEALDNVRAALAGLKSLADVTGDNRLARCIVQADSPFEAGIESEEAHNTVHQAGAFVWLDNTSRDQVVGAFLGLGVAYDFVDDAQVKQDAADLTARLIGFVARHQWSPNDDISNTFLVRPEELRMLLAVANHVNPNSPVSAPFLLGPVGAAVPVDVVSVSSYFKFNLDYMSFYQLLRLQSSADGLTAYQVVRGFTASHQNAFFNMVDRAIQGPDAARDLETRQLLDQWLQRPLRNAYVDVSGTVKVCGSEACSPVPVPLRPPTDYIWQRNPFQLAGGGAGDVESAGIDYTLPYWMARFYGVIGTGTTVQSAAAPLGAIAADSLASVFGTFSSSQVTVTDAAGVTRTATVVYASAGQINFLVPAGTAPGVAVVRVGDQTARVAVQVFAPALFSLEGTGSGVAAATAVRADRGGLKDVPVFRCSAAGCVAVPIDVSDAAVYVSLYGTGIRHGSGVTAHVGDLPATVLYAGPAPPFPGLDQVNVLLPVELRGRGTVAVMVGGSNLVQLNIQ